MKWTESDSSSSRDSGGAGAATAARRKHATTLVRQLRTGDNPDDPFRALFEIYYRPLQRFFARKGFNTTDAMDLTQETFLGIYKGLRGLRNEDRFESWLYQIATTTYLKRLRTGSTAKRTGQEVPHDELGFAYEATQVPADQLDDVLRDERKQTMRDAIQELPDQMRRCLTLRIYHDLSYQEIATVMKLKIGTVKAHLSQAKARLQESLGPYSVDLPD